MHEQSQSVVHSTFVIERSYPTKPERVFAAFSDPATKRRWFVESGGHEVDTYELDFRVGGKETACFRFKPGTPVAGLTCITDTSYEYIVPNSRVVFASNMTIGGKCISASLVTVELLPTEAGTDLICTHQGAFFEGSDGPQMREQGWRTLLDRLPSELAR
jgi:uncharacterized protein YndB with AHSA1/START domain